MMKKLIFLLAFLLPLVASAQTYPSPTFNILTLQTPLAASSGGTGIANSSNITLAGPLVTSGAFSLTLTTTAATNVTLPVSGTLLTSASVAGTYAPIASPTFTGSVTIPGGSINGSSIGATTASTGSFTSLQHSLQETDKSYTYNTPTTGTTVTIATGTGRAIIAPAGTLAALTITLPACSSGYDGSLVKFDLTVAVTALTVNATSGTVSNAPTVGTAGQTNSYICRGTNTTWYPL
jgi:hypothetical protein